MKIDNRLEKRTEKYYREFYNKGYVFVCNIRNNDTYKNVKEYIEKYKPYFDISTVLILETESKEETKKLGIEFPKPVFAKYK